MPVSRKPNECLADFYKRVGVDYTPSKGAPKKTWVAKKKLLQPQPEPEPEEPVPEEPVPEE